MLDTPGSGAFELEWHDTTIGNSGQIRSLFFTGVLFVH